MTTEEATLIAALIAALTSIVTLGLNTRLAVLKEKRMMLWEKELERLHQLEETAGIATEIALSYLSPESLDREFPEIHDELRHAAGRFGRYPALCQAIRDLNHACAVTVAEKTRHGDPREWAEKIKPAHAALIEACDRITKREKT